MHPRLLVEKKFGLFCYGQDENLIGYPPVYVVLSRSAFFQRSWHSVFQRGWRKNFPGSQCIPTRLVCSV